MQYKTSKNKKRKLQNRTLGQRQCSRSRNSHIYNPETNEFAALGHGILDIDTEKLINISSGEFVTTNILKIEKRRKRKSRTNTRNIRKTKKK